MADDTFPKTREEVELAKLRHELSLLQRPFWRDPKLLGAVIAFLVSASVNVGQFIREQSQSHRAERELLIKEQLWNTEMTRLKLEIEKLTQENAKRERNTHYTQQLAEELAKVSKDITVWENARMKDEVNLIGLHQKLADYEREGREEMAEAQRKNIAATQQALQIRKSELEKSTTRRAEIEKQLEK